MLESDRPKPLDADVDIFFTIGAPRQIEVAASWRAGSHKHCVVALVQHALQAIDIGFEVGVDAHVEDVVDLFIEDSGR